ncbi:MAG: ABC transporter permease [Bacteroidales bacterium]
MNIYKIAKRNIWRNKKRTLITSGSVFIALLLAIFMYSIQRGAYAQIVDDTIGSITGYLQIQNSNYQDDPTLDNSIAYTDNLFHMLKDVNGIKTISPKIESAGIISLKTKSKAVVIFGVDPFMEKPLSPTSKSIKGRTLTKDDNSVLISEKLAEYLKIKIGDTIVLVSTGYHGVSAANLFPICGTIKISSLEMNNKTIYMSIKNAQEFFSLKNKVSYLAIDVFNPKELSTITENVELVLNRVQDSNIKKSSTIYQRYVVKNWRTLAPELVKSIKADLEGAKIMMGILYFVLFFGILGTMMMMIDERKKEFIVLMVVGMSKFKICLSLVIEILIIWLISVLAAYAVGIPLILYFTEYPITFTGSLAEIYESMGFNPIMPASGMGPYMWQEALKVLSLFIMASIIPIMKVKKWTFENMQS